jgi:CubicO group peptidase (beta-lactamase class C family)
MTTPHSVCIRVVAILVILTCIPRLEALAQPSPPGTEGLPSRIEEYMAARVKRDRFSGSVLIAKDGKVLFSQGYGMANIEHDVPNTPQTKFRLGSISKQFTAMAILILQERGKLSVHDKVKKFLPDAPKAWDGITIHHLLTHTSGIPNYTAFPEFIRTLPVRVTLKELIAKFKDKPLDFTPGEKHRYSNSGYIVLGQIIETVAGQSYASFLGETIFSPLGMKSTGYDSTTTIIKHRAAGYTRRLGLFLTNCDYIDMSIPHAAGALYSTVEDLLKWDQALYTEKLVTKKSRITMFTPFKDNYAYGWVIDERFGERHYAHGGGIMGFVTTIERYPRQKVLIVALSNLETAPVSQIGADLGAIVLGKPYVVPHEPKEVKLDRALYDAYVGQYEVETGSGGKDKESEVVTVAREGDRLSYQFKGKAKVVIIPESATTFHVQAEDSEAHFLKDAAGKVTKFELVQYGRVLYARRIGR